ncbi:uncharacterized protein SCHCODRAFT_02617369 [Schizophyllum commune H4-8]|uniref:uncharacterized protein n=1 Tax=Schizophyllum commune (strain H4-8 / FGSC 9210) TaxID=578458 RepID=UPI00215DF67A|nr:uncharacterized protein SCHCODRAFT_02617369 [Schizophyllum commune H4-8]KAI5894602.1 hypothetical protein SCHCODRAFT_02617369 [Schizophyllum commune H4-8]
MRTTPPFAKRPTRRGGMNLEHPSLSLPPHPTQPSHLSFAPLPSPPRLRRTHDLLLPPPLRL